MAQAPTMTWDRPARPRCAAFIATSLDGYIARADGRIDWLAVAELPGEDYGFQAFLDSTDVLVLGRKTYDTAVAFPAWPYEGKRCVVMTHRPGASRHGEGFFAGEPLALVDRLTGDGARGVYVDGGDVIGQFINAGLLDELIISVLPILLGGGRPLFGAGAPEQRLSLKSSRAWPSGVVQLRYQLRPGELAPPAEAP